MVSLYNSIEARMEYIQRLFLNVQNFMQENHPLNKIISFLDTEPREYRSVAYESASMMIAIEDFSCGGQLNEWEKFYLHGKNEHSAHIEVGLGLAFGKIEISPTPYLDSLKLVMPWMVYDGIGYYNGLFKGRRTVSNQEVPEYIDKERAHWFDQGLGRRLWYVAQGDVKIVFDLVQSFVTNRQSDLWRGVGIACAYVGGNEKSNLELFLNYSGTDLVQLSNGVVMAGLSRIQSGSVSKDIEFISSFMSRKSLEEISVSAEGIMKKLDNKPGDCYLDWLNQFEKELGIK